MRRTSSLRAHFLTYNKSIRFLVWPLPETAMRTLCNCLVGVSPYAHFFFSHTFTFQLLDKLWSQVSTLVPPRFLPSIFIAHRVQQSHRSSIFHRVLLTHALALSASQFMYKKKSQRIYTSMHSAGLELTKLTYTRLEDNLIRHRGDRLTLRDIIPVACR